MKKLIDLDRTHCNQCGELFGIHSFNAIKEKLKNHICKGYMIPENPSEALSMRLKPCDYCNVGWSSISANETKSCSDTCEYWKEYWKKYIEGIE